MAKIAHSQGFTRLSVTYHYTSKIHINQSERNPISSPAFPAHQGSIPCCPFPLFSSAKDGSHMSPTEYGRRVDVPVHKTTPICRDTGLWRCIRGSSYAPEMCLTVLKTKPHGASMFDAFPKTPAPQVVDTRIISEFRGDSPNFPSLSVIQSPESCSRIR